MSDRDKYGNFVNNEGVTIKINTDRNGNEHISLYDKPVDEPHAGVHVNVGYEKEAWNTTTHNEEKSDTERSSGGCYLTSACMQHFQEKFDDNCEELNILRDFRDKFVSKEDVAHYYQTAPIIVEAINNSENNDSIYNYIYKNIVNACVCAIKKGDYEFAYNRYKSSVVALEEQFARPALEQRFVKVLKFNNKTV